MIVYFKAVGSTSFKKKHKNKPMNSDPENFFGLKMFVWSRAK